MIDRPHISASQLDSYCRCPEAYRRRYIEGEKIPPGMAMLRGTGLHKGVATNMTQKIESHVDLPASDIVDAAVAGFETELHGGYSLSTDENFRGQKIVVSETKDVVAKLAAVHAKEQAPDYQPILVEKSVRIELPGSRDLLGIIDLADDQGRVTDFKTGSKSKSQADADSSVQLSVYAAGYHALTGEPPVLVQLDTLVIGKKGIKRNLVESGRSERDLVALANRINAVSSGIDSGNFPPASPGSWWCSDRWCGFYSTCPYVNSERAAHAESE